MLFSQTFFSRGRIARRLLLLTLLALWVGSETSCVLAAGSGHLQPRRQFLDWRAAWVPAKSITSPQLIDQMLNRAGAAGLNRILVNVFYNGETLFDSSLAPKYPKVSAGFDPLAYLVPKAHDRGIKVDAWFLVGRVAGNDASPIISAHPDWALVGPDGDTIPWLNFARPDVRQFVLDLMLETVDRYGVDGLHFDYLRYPGPSWGFDPYSIEAFNKAYGLDLNQLRYADLPAYGVFEGNRLTNPTTAQVLASFNDGLPAVTLNRYGEGQVMLLNWDADERFVAADSEIVRRGLRYMLPNGGRVYVFHSNPDSRGYYEGAVRWMESLGWTPIEASESDLPSLTSPSVLVLSNAYVISPEAADALANYIQKGGQAIFIDGPSSSISLEPIQAITGMRSKAGYFSAYEILIPNGDSPLIPVSQRTSDLSYYRALDDKWMEFRQQSINALIQDVSSQAKKSNPNVLISVTITSDQEKANFTYLQDWQAWLEGGYVDVLIPRCYVDRPDQLLPVLEAWRPVISANQGKFAIGLIAFHENDPSSEVKPAPQLLTEMGIVGMAGSDGFVVFDLSRMSDEQLSAVKGFSFKSRSQP
jgi:uncharacterized lipoprotein YddW (UPF0748 family)